MKYTILTTMIAVALLLTAAGRATGEELALFQAASAGPDAWGWGDAKIKKGKGNTFSIQENGKQKNVGDVYTLDKFSYLTDGLVELDIGRVVAGTYTLQVLAFKNDAMISTVDAVSNSTKTGDQKIQLKDLNLPAETEAITFKIWVGGTKGAGIVLNDLKYLVSIPSEKIAFDKAFNSETTDVITEKTSWSPSDGGGTISLMSNNPDDAIGSAVLPDLMKNPTQGTLWLEVPSVKNGNITIQLVAFDENASYLKSVEVLNKVGAGLHAIPLGKVQWPAGTDSYKVKIWIGGDSGSIATAALKRMMVVK